MVDFPRASEFENQALSTALPTGDAESARLSRLRRSGLQLSEHRFILRMGDLLASATAVAIALWIWTVVSGDSFTVVFLREHARWFVAVVPWMLLLMPAYHVSVAFSVKATANTVARAAVAGAVLYPLVYFFAPRQVLPRLVVLYFLVVASALTLAWRLAYVHIFTRAQHRHRVAIVGAGRAGQAIAEVLRRVARHTVVVAFVDDDKTEPRGRVDGVPVFAGPEGLRRVVAEQSVSEIVLATRGKIKGPLFRALVDCQEAGADVVGMSTVYERLLQRIPINNLQSDWMFTSLVDAVRLHDASRLAKGTLDIIGGLVGTLIFLLAVPLLGPAIWLNTGRPVLFRQLRIGRGNEPFRLIKFRTMVQDAERDGPRWAGANDRRVTLLGRFLRRSRLDEIPQFLNVLKGDMSLVGPRPERPEFVAELEQTIPFYRTRLMVRPGLTGWAQVNYRYGDSVTDAALKLEYDLYYIKHRSLLFDLAILVRTVKTILTFRGR